MPNLRQPDAPAHDFYLAGVGAARRLPYSVRRRHRVRRASRAKATVRRRDETCLKVRATAVPCV